MVCCREPEIDDRAQLIYAVDQHTSNSVTLKLTGRFGLPEGYRGATSVLQLRRDDEASEWVDDSQLPWQIHRLFNSTIELEYLENLPDQLVCQSGRGYGDQITSAAMVNIADTTMPRAVLIFGLNSRSAFDEAYRDFLLQIGKTLNSRLLVAKEHEAEKFERVAKAHMRRAEEAESARKAQEFFVDVVNHEIRSPLGAIVQATDLLESTFIRLLELITKLESNTPGSESLSDESQETVIRMIRDEGLF